MEHCDALIAHLNRIEGQINAIKKKITDKPDCAAVVELMLATSNSFKSLRVRFIEDYILNELLAEKKLTPKKVQNFHKALSLAKA